MVDPFGARARTSGSATVQVTPIDSERTDKVEVIALVNAASAEEAEAMLPSVESLTALALDERLAPPAE